MADDTPSTPDAPASTAGTDTETATATTDQAAAPTPILSLGSDPSLGGPPPGAGSSGFATPRTGRTGPA